MKPPCTNKSVILTVLIHVSVYCTKMSVIRTDLINCLIYEAFLYKKVCNSNGFKYVSDL